MDDSTTAIVWVRVPGFIEKCDLRAKRAGMKFYLGIGLRGSRGGNMAQFSPLRQGRRIFHRALDFVAGMLQTDRRAFPACKLLNRTRFLE